MIHAGTKLLLPEVLLGVPLVPPALRLSPHPLLFFPPTKSREINIYANMAQGFQSSLFVAYCFLPYGVQQQVMQVDLQRQVPPAPAVPPP